MPETDPRREAVLVLAPTGRDARLIAAELARHGFGPVVCDSLDQLCAGIDTGAGLALLAEEALPPAGLAGLVAALGRQPPWSDLPLLILTGKGTPSRGSVRRFEALEPVANVTQLERPVRTRTLVSAVRSAARARRRQYDVRDHLAERERQAAALRAGEARLQLAVDIAHMGVFDIDLLTDAVVVNEPGRDIYGWADTRTTFARVQTHFHPDDRERVLAQVGRAFDPAGPGAFEVEQRIIRPDGGVRWIRVRGRAFFAGQGADRRAVRCVGTYLDVTDRKRADEALRASEGRFRTLFESMDQGFCVIEVTVTDGRAADYRFVELNPAFERHTGLRDMLGRSVREAVPGLEEFWFDTYGRVATTGRPTRFVHHAAPLDRWFEVYAFRLDAAGRHRVAVLFTDVTDRKRAEEELRDADRRKDEFLAVLAHELRNPLAPIRNGLQVLHLAGHDSAAAERARGMMDRQLAHMVRLIDDLLDVSRITRNKMELRRARVPLADVIAAAVETVRPAVDAAGHRLSVALPDPPAYLDADLTRLAQVFANLLSNAAKYTPPGGHIGLTAEARGGQAVVTVRDTGIGIPPEAVPRIFDMFSQVDRSVERSTGGLGIGLALVKGLVEMHGGTVAAASGGQGAGSEFTVRLPLMEPPPPPDRAADNGVDAAPAAGRRILVVDDNRDGAESLALMLRLMGNEVSLAHDGVEAVEAAGRVRPEVILMDVGMPRLNGLDAARRIREQPWGRAVTIVALTGWGQENDRERSRAAGCDGHLVKPVAVGDLFRVLAAVRV